MYEALAVLIVLTLLVWLFRVREVPAPAAGVPWQHLETRRATIYENLRDLQFEYRVGKLSDADYQATKTGLQSELAAVLAEIDRLKGSAPEPPPPSRAARDRKGAVCPHCQASFDKPLKFCGECGKPMIAGVRS